MAAGAKVFDTKYYSSTIDIVFEKSINLFESKNLTRYLIMTTYRRSRDALSYLAALVYLYCNSN